MAEILLAAVEEVFAEVIEGLDGMSLVRAVR
jgi:hypothetical protein